MKKNHLILSSFILIGCVILGSFYYASEKEKRQSIERQQLIKIAEDKKAADDKNLQNAKSKCIDFINGQEDEIRKLTTYSPFVEDRGCFIEAGCEQGVKDDTYKAKFSTCHNDYYNNCLNGLKEEANKKFEAERQKRILDCISLYQLK